MLAIGTLALPTTWSGVSSASTLRGLTLNELTRAAQRVALARAVQKECRWESVAGTRRIVTLTRFVQETDLKRAKALSDRIEDEFLAMTLGGRVGDLGQKISGEAAVPVSQEALLFLSAEQSGHRRILGMAQGAYLMVGSGTERSLRAHENLPRLVGERRGKTAAPERRFAVDVLGGASLSAALRLVRGAQ